MGVVILWEWLYYGSGYVHEIIDMQVEYKSM